MLQRIIISLYFRYFKELILFSKLLTGKAQQSRRWNWIFHIIQRGIAGFYFGEIISEEKAIDLINNASAIKKAPCICASVNNVNSRGCCYYLGEWAEIYEKHGPLNTSDIIRSAALKEIKERDTEHCHLMTVNQTTKCIFFPKEYVICICDLNCCIPWGYQNIFPGLAIVVEKTKRPSSFTAYIMFLLALPIFFLSYFYLMNS